MKKGLKALGTSGWPKIPGKKRKIQMDGREGDRREEEEKKKLTLVKKKKKGSPISYSATPSALEYPFVLIL